jgi:hypothetical protein
MAKLLQVVGTSAFAEHLRHRVAGNDMSEHENHGEDKPERRKSEQETE